MRVLKGRASQSSLAKSFSSISSLCPPSPLLPFPLLSPPLPYPRYPHTDMMCDNRTLQRKNPFDCRNAWSRKQRVKSSQSRLQSPTHESGSDLLPLLPTLRKSHLLPAAVSGVSETRAQSQVPPRQEPSPRQQAGPRPRQQASAKQALESHPDLPRKPLPTARRSLPLLLHPSRKRQKPQRQRAGARGNTRPLPFPLGRQPPLLPPPPRL